jgi:hypothetical protein
MKMNPDLSKKNGMHPFTTLKSEEGYILIIVTLIGLVLAIIFGNTLPQLHGGQQIRAINNLNEYRAYEAARKGIDSVRLGLKNLDDFQDLIGPASNPNNKGIAWAIKQLSGATASKSQYDEYKDEEGNPQFVSGCQGIDLGGNEKGILQVAIIVSRGMAPNRTMKTYFYDNGDMSQWPSTVNPPVNTVNYFNFDSSGLDDFKYRYDGIRTWSYSIGNAESFRKDFEGSELWSLVKEVPKAGERRPFFGKNNDGDSLTDPGDGSVDPDDVMDVFIIVRSTGITAAPGPNYRVNKTDLRLVNDATNGALPNPMRQVLEAGFYLIDAGGGLEVRRFYFGQAHNLD